MRVVVKAENCHNRVVISQAVSWTTGAKHQGKARQSTVPAVFLADMAGWYPLLFRRGCAQRARISAA